MPTEQAKPSDEDTKLANELKPTEEQPNPTEDEPEPTEDAPKPTEEEVTKPAEGEEENKPMDDALPTWNNRKLN